jgi:hypothetical protein
MSLPDAVLDITTDEYKASIQHALSQPIDSKLSFNDAYEIVSKKILINKMSMELLATQMKFSEISIKMQKHTNNIAGQKIQITNQINILLELQLTNFTDARQSEGLDLYVQLHKLDPITTDHRSWLNAMDALREKMINLSGQIDALERTIPNEKLITQYHITNKN